MSAYILPLFLVSFGLLLLAPAPVSADSDDLLDYIKEIEPLQIRKSPFGCPVAVIGTQCPQENVFWYFKCCGNILDQCCFRLQDWVVCLLLVLTLCTILSIIINCLRCIFCN